MPFRDEEDYEPSLWKEVGLPMLVAILLACAVGGPIIYVEYFR